MPQQTQNPSEVKNFIAFTEMTERRLTPRLDAIHQFADVQWEFTDSVLTLDVFPGGKDKNGEDIKDTFEFTHSKSATAALDLFEYGYGLGFRHGRRSVISNENP